MQGGVVHGVLAYKALTRNELQRYPPWFTLVTMCSVTTRCCHERFSRSSNDCDSSVCYASVSIEIPCTQLSLDLMDSVVPM